MKFFTRKASRALRTKKGTAEWDRLWAEYEQQLKRIRHRLPTGWRRIAATNFHDSEVFSFGPLYKDEFLLNLDMNPRWKQPPWFICSLHFYGVHSANVPSKAQDDVVLYDEVHVVRKRLFEWRALLVHSELTIRARGVRYFINHEPLL